VKLIQARFVQVQNPRSKGWILIDRYRGLIVARKRTPFKGIKVVNQ
jgi:hypothetical protein